MLVLSGHVSEDLLITSPLDAARLGARGFCGALRSPKRGPAKKPKTGTSLPQQDTRGGRGGAAENVVGQVGVSGCLWWKWWWRGGDGSGHCGGGVGLQLKEHRLQRLSPRNCSAGCPSLPTPRGADLPDWG